MFILINGRENLDLVRQNSSAAIHQINKQILVTKMFKAKNDLNPVMKEDVFKFKSLTKNFERAVANCPQRLLDTIMLFHFTLFVFFRES